MNNQVLAYANCPVRELKSAVGVVEDQMRVMETGTERKG